MSDERIEVAKDEFIAVAIEHGLLEEEQAVTVLDHARDRGISPADAALTLSVLKLHEVEALNLLLDPTGLAPGYRLIGLIGCGAGGMVFRAHQVALERDVALKTINARAAASETGESRIQREARAIAKVRHPGIVTAFDSGFFKGRFCIAMELVDGETLAEFIRREGPMVERVAWQIARQVACALSHAFEAGIVHRDIKPTNLLLCEPPEGMPLPRGIPSVKVVDFGLAIDEQATQITATGVSLGTPAYVAPEQLQNPRVDARADIFSLGATVFEMLTGRVPCIDQSPMKTIMQKSIGDDRWRVGLPDTISNGSRSLFLEMTETDIEDRIASYEILIQRIDDLLDRLETLGIPSPTRSSPSESKSTLTPAMIAGRTKLAVIFTAFVILAIGTVAGIRFSTRKSSGTIEDVRRWTINGFPRPLFNGVSVPLFRKSGHWSPGHASDGSRVLIGTAGSRMTIPLSLQGTSTQNLRLRLGINLTNGGKAELRIRFAGSPVARATLRLSSDLVELLTVGENETIGVARSISLSHTAEHQSVFQNVAILRRDSSTTIVVNGQELGTIKCDPNSSGTVELYCVQSTTHFADIDIVRLLPDTTR